MPDASNAPAKRGANAAPNAPPLIAVDDGYAQVKVWSPTLKLVAPACVRAGEGSLLSLDGQPTSPSYETEGATYTASDMVPTEDTRLDGYHQSALNRVAVHHALHLAGVSGEVSLSVGLPVREFYRGGQPNKAAADGKRDSFAKPVTPLSGLAPIKVARLRIFPQAIAAWADYALANDVSVKPGVSLDSVVAVVDVGGRTTDIAVIVGKTIDHARSGTINEGVLNVRDRVISGIREAFDLDDALPARIYDNAIRTGFAQIWGRNHDVTNHIETGKRELLERVTRYVRQRIGRGADLATVIFVGGGTVFLADLIATYPNAVVADDPEFANSRGLWKFARNRELRELSE